MPGPTSDTICDTHCVLSHEIGIFTYWYCETQILKGSRRRGARMDRATSSKSAARDGMSPFWDAICADIKSE